MHVRVYIEVSIYVTWEYIINTLESKTCSWMCLRHGFISFKLPQPFFGHCLWTNVTTFYGADGRMAQDVYANEERSARLWIPRLSPFPQAPGPAGLARTCLESQQCTPTEVIYYLFPSYLFVSVS